MGNAKTAITPTRADDYPEWYQQVIKAADMAENSSVRGCMVIKPWGYTLWENIQRALDDMFKATGHVNAYFPLFIPKSFLEREAKHVEGFAKECAVVTHSRLVDDGQGGLKPDSPLEEPLIVRPTSETIIGASYANWVQSYRDLPILINQWANVVRWEMRTRLFLRTTEFLWQEGHTAHATSEEAMEETRKMLEVYADFAENWMAMPVIKGEKTEGERFPGADHTYSIEAMMQDRKALQAGTSHFLGQNFAKGCGIKFLNEKGEQEFAWTTSWGVSTRLVGGIIMTHSDDDGLVLPPKLAPKQVIILPVLHKADDPGAILEYCAKIKAELENQLFANRALQVEIDKRDIRGGDKRWEWIKKGAPIILEVGPRDMAQDSVFAFRRDTGEKKGVGRAEFIATAVERLNAIQDNLLARAKAHREEHTHKIDSKDEFIDFFTAQNADRPEIHGGFAMSHWGGTAEEEDALAKAHKVTIRCVPLEGENETGVCPFTGNPSPKRVVFAKSY
ncbi:proline--tRNA ligase [Cerasicoccus arenae]|uniref:Proline--tRNA ligase n=1 Tax=Cerasicoccus arenae TaxID=424488 RepID=A0A8J3DH33_9BACT|nr:proline--tRNA ligase [Cerasicoccus arenae]GHB99274.1 proline--tRNA ligase [Cerasicoccus arenae]